MVVALLSCALVGREASPWLSWPIFIAALAAVAAGLINVLEGVERGHAHA